MRLEREGGSLWLFQGSGCINPRSNGSGCISLEESLRELGTGTENRGAHTTPEQAGTVFTRVKPKLAVYSHIVPPDASDLVLLTRKTDSGPLELARI
jgi:hypothetical protein